MGEDYRWRFRIIQDGQPVAGGDAPDRKTAMREMIHYAMVYGQDGPVTCQMRTGKNKWKDVQHDG